MTEFVTNVFLFCVSFLFASVFVGIGWLLGSMLDMEDMFLPVVLVVACFMFMYMKYVTQLRIENQSLRIIRDMIEQLPEKPP